MTVTIKDIARMANVSHTTVSRALKDSPEISAETRHRIKELAKRLNYTSNALARGLVLKRSDSIGLIIPDIINPYYAHISKAVEGVASSQNFSLIICNTDRSPEKERQYLQFLRAKQVDGIIMVSVSNDPEPLQDLLRDGIPLVLIDNLVPGVAADFITNDNFAGATAAVEHLIRLGKRSLVHFAGPRDSFASQERLRAYLEGMAAHGLSVAPDWVIPTNATFDGGEKAARQLIHGHGGELPDAVFAVNDSVAMGALKYFYRKGVRVPENLALVGYDDIEMAAMLPVPLTTVRQRKYELGRVAAQMILDRILAPDDAPQPPPKAITFQPRLVVRRSCGENREDPKG